MPNLPMPVAGGVPIAPALALMLFSCFVIFRKNRAYPQFYNTYVRIIIVLQFALLLTDILRIFLFDVSSELFYPVVRVVNLLLFIVFTGMFIRVNTDGLLTIDRRALKFAVIGVILLCVVLIGQTTGIINIGKANTGRSFFGLKVPFYKPVGFFGISDGKLGIIIAPFLFYYIVNSYGKLKFNKVKRAYLYIF